MSADLLSKVGDLCLALAGFDPSRLSRRRARFVAGELKVTVEVCVAMAEAAASRAGRDVAPAGGPAGGSAGGAAAPASDVLAKACEVRTELLRFEPALVSCRYAEVVAGELTVIAEQCSYAAEAAWARAEQEAPAGAGGELPLGPAELAALREAMARYAARFDPSVVTGAQAAAVVDHAAAIEKMSATVKALAAARVAGTGAWDAEGDRSAAHALARRTGTTVSRAKDAIRTAERLATQPALEAAARAGRVSAEQAAAISDAAVASPGALGRLVRTAERESLANLRDECERTRAAADRDAEARHRRIHAARHARRRNCADGSGEVVYRSTRDEVAEIWAVVCGYADEVFRAARAQGRHEPAEAYAADAMLQMARVAAGAGGAASGAGPQATGTQPTGSAPATAPCVPASAGAGPSPPARRRLPVPTKIIVRIDWPALMRGWPTEGEVCEIAGVGPVPVSAVRAMIDTADPFLAAVVTKGADVVNVVHLGRRATAHQKTALQWMQPVCTVEGCDARARLEVDHRRDWALTHVTRLPDLDHHCHHHHDLKTYQQWSLVEGSGKRPFVPPHDLRHPRHPRHTRHTGNQARPPPEEPEAA